MSRLEDAAKVLDEERAYWDSRDHAIPVLAEQARDESSKARATAALLRAIDAKHGPWIEDPTLCAWCPSSWPCPDHLAALALADTLLPTEGTKP